ncbi:hypothetical protein [Cryobacterium sp. BB736]|uniref:hypothetical protein n=1 Tax=Cryobacterium sp. BB736 TaxID=2746963 RepID=UPI001D0BF254|nr:hypothetical protein [Cryobacterium sp. BB736]
MITGTRSITVAAVAGILLAVAAAAPAAAAVPGVQVSRDGVTYGNILAAPVFSTTPNLVPNGSAQATFWLKNESTVQTMLRIDAANITLTGDAEGAFLLQTSTAAGNYVGQPATLDPASDCTVLLSGVHLMPGQVTTVTVTVSMADLTGQRGQNASASADLLVSLRDDIASDADLAACPPAANEFPVFPSTGTWTSLPFTGGTVNAPLIAAAGLLVGAGLWFVIAAYRRRRRDEEVQA